jgi:hypothetical protein
MNYLIAALAVYKLVQLADSLTPKEAMPWVKIVFSIIISYPISIVLGTPNIYIDGLSIAALAGVYHAMIRLLMLLGDNSKRKVIR